MTTKILIIEDEKHLETLIKKRFKKKNQFHFLFTKIGNESLEVLDKDQSINLILIDIDQGKPDGLSLLKEIKELNRSGRSLVVTAVGDQENIRSAMNNGAFDFISKPVDFKVLENSIGKMVKEWDEISQYKQQEREQFLEIVKKDLFPGVNELVELSNLVLQTRLTELQLKYLKGIQKSSESLLVVLKGKSDALKVEPENTEPEPESNPVIQESEVLQIHEVFQLKSDHQPEIIEESTFSVLIVDDNDDNIKTTTETLNSLFKKINIKCAENGKVAVELLLQRTYDIVLMDLNMPEMGGIEATKIIRSRLQPPVSDVPIIAISSSRNEEVACYDAGMNGFISKPYQPEQIKENILRFVQTGSSL